MMLVLERVWLGGVITVIVISLGFFIYLVGGYGMFLLEGKRKQLRHIQRLHELIDSFEWDETQMGYVVRKGVTVEDVIELIDMIRDNPVEGKEQTIPAHGFIMTDLDETLIQVREGLVKTGTVTLYNMVLIHARGLFKVHEGVKKYGYKSER